MSISTKILLFAAVAIGVICVLGGSFLLGAQTGRQIRERLVTSQDQLDSLGQLEDGVWPYLNALSRARVSGQDTAVILRAHKAWVEAKRVKFDAHLSQEEDHGGGPGEFSSREREREEIEHALQALHRWMESTEARLRLEPEGVPVAPSMEWALYQDYEREVGQHIASIQEAERAEQSRLRRQWDTNLGRALAITVGVTFGCIVLMVLLALSILLPLRGALRELRLTAERIGRGDFEVALPEMGHDELGLLARAMDRMASELRDTLQEKQRLMKAEAEASEREARRYSAMLEETVRARTSELEAANARLAESLQQLKAAQEQLLFSDRLATIGRLAAGVAHEINNPLAYIVSNLQFIQSEIHRLGGASSPEGQELRDAITEAGEGAERVRFIVQDLKMLSRPDDVALGPVDLGLVVRGATKIAAQELRGRARLVEDCQGVPPVWGNGPRLGQVLLNLLINAAHAIEPGDERRNEVRVAARVSDSQHLTLEVSDTGCGIPPENLKRIFDPFFTTKPIGLGTGLGLSVCRTIITSLGGTIEVESEVGRGTTFRITLPLADGKEPSGSSGKTERHSAVNDFTGDV